MLLITAIRMTCLLAFSFELMQPQADVAPTSVAAARPSSQELQIATTSEHHQQLQQSVPAPQQDHPDIPQQPQQSSQPIESNSQPSQPSAAIRGSHNSQGRKISCEDIQLVQNLIERCLQLYMNQGEVINTLLSQAKIEPGFTGLVWQKLEEQNPDFFKAYYTRLKLKKHIVLFNHLLDQQVQLMQKMRMLPTKTLVPPPAASSHLSVQSVPVGFPMPQLSPMTMSAAHALNASLSIPPPSPPLLHMEDSMLLANEDPGQSEMMELPSELKSSGSGFNSDLNLGPVSSASPNGAAFPFNTISTSLDMTSIGMGLPTSMPLDPATFSYAHDPHPQNGINLPLSSAHDGDGNSTRELLGALGHIPRNFSLSDLTAELGSHSDLGGLGSYSSPFTTDTENFLLYSEKENYDDSKLLDPMDMEFAELK